MTGSPRWSVHEIPRSSDSLRRSPSRWISGSDDKEVKRCGSHQNERAGTSAKRAAAASGRGVMVGAGGGLPGRAAGAGAARVVAGGSPQAVKEGPDSPPAAASVVAGHDSSAACLPPGRGCRPTRRPRLAQPHHRLWAMPPHELPRTGVHDHRRGRTCPVTDLGGGHTRPVARAPRVPGPPAYGSRAPKPARTPGSEPAGPRAPYLRIGMAMRQVTEAGTPDAAPVMTP